MRNRKPITADHTSGWPGFSRAARDALVARQPATVFEALKVPGVGRKATKKLLALGLITDPERLQARSLAQVFGRGRTPTESDAAGHPQGPARM